MGTAVPLSLALPGQKEANHGIRVQLRSPDMNFRSVEPATGVSWQSLPTLAPRRQHNETAVTAIHINMTGKAEIAVRDTLLLIRVIYACFKLG